MMTKDIYSGQPVSASSIVWTLFIVVLFSTGWYLFQGTVGLNLWDEGYLWHNIQRTFEGGVPILDFRSYDPGRYYWSALWFDLLGPGIMTQRFSIYVIQMAGLFFGLLAVSRVITAKWQLLPIALLMLLWFFPRHKLIVHSLIMIAIYGAVSILENASIRRHFLIGLFTGITACIARDFAVYFFLSFAALIAFVGSAQYKRDLRKKYIVWILGISIGYLPIIAMMIFIPGFSSAYLDFIARLFSAYTPFKPLPIPWPWKMTSADFRFDVFCLGIGYMLQWVFYACSVIYIGFSRDGIRNHNPLFLSCIFIGTPILLHANGRADFGHFAQGIHPMLIALIALGFWAVREKKIIIAALTCSALIFSLVLVLTGSREISMALRKTNIQTEKEKRLAQFTVGVDTLWLDQEQIALIKSVQKFAKNNLKPGENILISPLYPGLYPILKKNAPIWDAWPIHNATIAEQERSIKDIKLHRVVCAIIWNEPLDGREELRFSRTHPILWEYLMKNYGWIRMPNMPDNIYFLKSY